MSETNPSLQHGAFSWNELLSDDVEASMSFYQKLLNWKFEEAPASMPDDGRYILAYADETKAAGIMSKPAEAQNTPHHWGSYITVDNVDTTVEKAVSLGAKALTPLMDIPKVGRMCYLQDPQGAAFAVIRYEHN